ncbi:MAG: hypothetical protein WAN43_00585 [Rhodomicrobium sp.]
MPETDTERALARGAVTQIQPRHFFLDVSEETPAPSREDVLKPSYWVEHTAELRWADVVSVRAKDFSVDIVIGAPHEDGGFYLNTVEEVLSWRQTTDSPAELIS